MNPNGAGGSPLRVLWQHRWVLLLFVVAATVIAYLSSNRAEPQYEASASVQIISGRQLSGEFVGQAELLQLTNLAAELARTRQVAEIAADTLDLRASEVSRAVDVTARDQLQVLRITGKSGDAADAAAFANGYAAAFVTYLEELQEDQREAGLSRIQARVNGIQEELDERDLEPTDQGATGLNTELEALQTQAAVLYASYGDAGRIIQRAAVPSEPVSPSPIRDAVLAGVAAFLLGSMVVWLRNRLVDRYASADEVAEDLRLPVLAHLPRGSATDSATVEALRSLRTRVAFALRETPHPVLVTTSATPGAGKTHVSIGLARAFAAEGAMAALLDGDLRRPAVHQRLGLALRPGVGELLAADRAGAAEVEVTAQTVQVGRDTATRGGSLDVVTAGRHVEDAAEALSSERMRDTMRTLRSAYDIVIMDSPPLLAVVDPVVLARYADGVVLVVNARKDRRADVRRALQTLRAVDAAVFGVVYNNSSAGDRPYAYYGQDRPAEREGGLAAS